MSMNNIYLTYNTIKNTHFEIYFGLSNSPKLSCTFWQVYVAGFYDADVQGNTEPFKHYGVLLK